jgi:hypothetical protein
MPLSGANSRFRGISFLSRTALRRTEKKKYGQYVVSRWAALTAAVSLPPLRMSLPSLDRAFRGRDDCTAR